MVKLLKIYANACTDQILKQKKKNSKINDSFELLILMSI